MWVENNVGAFINTVTDGTAWMEIGYRFSTHILFLRNRSAITESLKNDQTKTRVPA